MKARPVIPRPLANQDVEGAIVYHPEQQAALGFIDTLEQADTCHPTSGIGRYAHELELPGLLCWPLKRYPHLVLYVERDDHIDVWRVLHGTRAIPEWLTESSSH